MIAVQLGGSALQCAPQGTAARRAGGRRVAAVRAAGRGFGSGPAKPGKREDEDQLVEGQGSGPRRLKSKGKKLARQPQPTQLAPMQSSAVEAQRDSLVEEIEFQQRLKALKEESEAKKAALAASKSMDGGATSLLDSPKAQELYDNPPPLTQTLLGGGKPAGSDISLAEYEKGTFGPSQAGLAIAAVLLGVVFIVASGGSDLGYATRRPTQQPTEATLPEEARKEVEGQLATLTAKLQEDADDLEALEGAAVLNVRLGKLEEARGQLQRLTKARPEDPEAWRVLAETQGALGEGKAAVEAYKKAWEASQRGSLEVLTGLASTLAAEGRGEEAVQLVQGVRDGGSAGLDAVDVQLLLGKSYAMWRGHQADALAVYDQLIAASPEDFRPYLAKGLLLREVGRLGDAQRYFLQAKYHAGNQRAAVEAVIGSE